MVVFPQFKDIFIDDHRPRGLSGRRKRPNYKSRVCFRYQKMHKADEKIRNGAGRLLDRVENVNDGLEKLAEAGAHQKPLFCLYKSAPLNIF